MLLQMALFHSFKWLSNISFIYLPHFLWASQVVLIVKNLPANTGDLRATGLIPESGRSAEGGHGNPL